MDPHMISIIALIENRNVMLNMACEKIKQRTYPMKLDDDVLHKMCDEEFEKILYDKLYILAERHNYPLGVDKNKFDQKFNEFKNIIKYFF
ncbi:putative ORFan [Cotonvirus japonicus]|uniref:ORFan n=1 Tax=Cotonvirus japonicus TaxID=2811091 RepID=A0ABM7NR79_9VIRU|nr:putative ORFan [Cotonvirus japonicus]BCS82660.1 putative ORFan [Cotonvirus japonicus]